MPSRRTSLAVAAGLLTSLGLGRAALADRYEQPAYDVVQEYDSWQLRDYAPSIEARVTVDAPFDRAVSDGFRVLANYIFGGNVPKQDVAMTSPVSAQPAGTSIAMTSPVSAVGSSEDVTKAQRWTVAFTMPSEWTLEALPEPEDPRVQLVEVEGGRYAVSQFSGWMRGDKAERERGRLMAGLKAQGLQAVGEPVIAQYDPPWTLPFFRTNEVLVPVLGG